MTTLLLLFTLLAQTADFETRYHDAYVLEVVDGKTADAARRYLDLLREPGLPKHLAAQCRFRFAVTCVLLGRADEARARLAALAADPDTPAALKPQIEEYRKALQDVGPGRAVDDKFEELKGRLAQAHPGDQEASYRARREWQAIGEPAVPYLKKLLDHPDQQLRVHAFIILCTLDVPNMAEWWKHDLPWIERDFEAYLKRNPAEVRIMERRLPGYGDNYLGPALSQLRTVPFSREFFEKLETRPVAPRLVEMVGVLGADTQREFLDRWIRGGNPELARAAAKRYVASPSFPESGLLGPICLLLAPQLPAPETYKGLVRMAKQVKPEERMRVFGELVAAGEKNPAVLTSNVPDTVAAAIDGDEFDSSVYSGLLRRWMAVLKDHPRHENHLLAYHLRAALRKLPEAQAVAWVRDIVRQDARYGDPIEYHDAFEVPWIVAALDATHGDARRSVALNVISRLDGATPFYLSAIAPLYPRLVALCPRDELGTAMVMFRHVATEIPDMAPARDHLGAAARAVATELVDTILKESPMQKVAADQVALLFASDTNRERNLESRYLRNVAIPLLQPVTERVGTDAARRAFAAKAYDVLVEDAHGTWDLKDARATLRTYVADHFAFLPDELHDFATVEPLIPPAKWMPYATPNVYASLRPERIRAAATAFARAPGEVTPRLAETLKNGMVIPLLEQRGAEILDALLAKAGPRELDMLVDCIQYLAPRPETLEALLARGLADPGYDMYEVAEVGRILATLRPSRKLYALIDRLLASEEPELMKIGIAMAASLGQPDLLPKLAKLLDSLDPKVRDRAMEAMQSINLLEKVRKEARSALEDHD